jgi:hypothetical protein
MLFKKKYGKCWFSTEKIVERIMPSGISTFNWRDRTKITESAHLQRKMDLDGFRIWKFKTFFLKNKPCDIRTPTCCVVLCCDLECYPSTNWWSGVSCACNASILVFCCCCTTWNSTKPSVKHAFQHAWSICSKSPDATSGPSDLPNTNAPEKTPHSTSLWTSTKSTHDSPWEDAPCTLNIFRGRNATQLVGGNFCLRQQKHAMCLPMAMANQAMPLRIAWTRVLHSPWQSMSSAFRLWFVQRVYRIACDFLKKKESP